jgi:Domain of unknown function (DUF4232)
MTRPTPYEQILETWLEDGPKSAPRDLLGSILIAVPQRRQHRGLFGVGRRLRVLSASARLTSAVAAVVLVGVVGVVALGFRDNSPFGGGGVATLSTSPSPSPTRSATPAPTATSVPTATPVPTIGACAAADLAARITLWEGAAGSRIADVELTNVGSTPCQLATLDLPQLIDGRGAWLIDSPQPAASDSLTINPGGVVKTLVEDGTYCGPAPFAPVSVAFVLPDGLSRVTATPLSPTDLSGVPPCLGPAGSDGHIEMHPWAP